MFINLLEHPFFFHQKNRELSSLADGFTRSEVVEKGWAGVNSTTAQGALEVLEEKFWIYSQKVQTGGKPKVVYYINPKLERRGQ